ncbi:uncharacterized protein NEPG_01417, partial [Nematocida parisii ERTm1]
MLIRKELIIIIGIVALCRICCRVGISTYEDLHNKEIGDGLCIRTNGPLFPARTFASEKCDLMHSMRFLSPGADINYSARVVINSSGDLISYFSRYFNKDKAYKIKQLS